jgi:uncharacterized protein (TIGR02145 family)
MKKIYSILAGLLLTATVLLTQQANAQAPQKMSYQSVLRNSSNVLLANTQVRIKISVLQGTASGTALYVETQLATTNGNGLLSIQIGTGPVTTGTFAGINWAGGPYFIKTETDPAGGSNYTITGTQEMLSVPYAMYAAKSVADSAQTAAITTLQTQIPATLNYTNGTATPVQTICCQSWMTKNLNVATYRNGDPIPKVTDNAAWEALTTGAYCYYNNDSATYAAVYGKLYNWYAVNDPRGLAPEGWHIPTDFDWTTLENCLGGASVAGGAMKETGTIHWTTPNTGATNISGWVGLPAGARSLIGTFFDVGGGGYWWSSTETTPTNAWFRTLYYNDGFIYRFANFSKPFGFSVRCLRD